MGRSGGQLNIGGQLTTPHWDEPREDRIYMTKTRHRQVAAAHCLTMRADGDFAGLFDT